MPATLERLEAVVDTSAVAGRIELLLPIGVRPRQLTVRTLLLGMLLTCVQGRPAHLRRVHQALTALAAHEHQRLGIIADWNTGPHVLGEPASSSYAVHWTDHETWSCPPPKKHAANPEPAASDPKPQATPSDTTHDTDPEHGTPADDNDDHRCADPEASWGHRRGNHPGQKDELFYGYYLQAATTVKDEHGPAVPELARRIHLASCDHDPPAAFVPVLQRMSASGI